MASKSCIKTIGIKDHLFILTDILTYKIFKWLVTSIIKLHKDGFSNIVIYIAEGCFLFSLQLVLVTNSTEWLTKMIISEEVLRHTYLKLIFKARM